MKGRTTEQTTEQQWTPEEVLPSGVVLGRRPKPWPRRGPSEESEQLRLVAALRRAGVHFVHVPMGGARGRRSGAALARMGARRGFPDLLILDPSGVWRDRRFEPSYSGVALEIKRPVRGSQPTEEQLAELALLAERGWYACVEWGADEALRRLRSLGYPV